MSKLGNANYDAKMAVYVSLKLNRRTDADIIAALDAAPNKQALIKQAMRGHIERSNFMIRPNPIRHYDYQGLMPYSAADHAAMDEFVPDDFSGNVTEELLRRGASWDDEAKVLTVKGMRFPIQYVK